MSEINLENGVLVIKTPYSPDFVATLKTIPAADRRYNPSNRTWEVDPKHGAKVQGWIAQYFREHVILPATSKVKAAKETRILEVRYIGACKDRFDGADRTAFGWSGGNWNVIFPEQVLRGWFNAEQSPDEQPTFYAALAIKNDATAEEIKAAYRRMAKQWHPDVCKEPNAAEQFKSIKYAYDILSESIKRAKYDAGLALEASLNSKEAHRAAKQMAGYSAGTEYRPPLRCGFIMAEGVEKLGRFNVKSILQWQDIVNNRGQTLVTSWPMGAESFVETWS